MIYPEETLNLTPATPATLDAFIELAGGEHVRSYQGLGARLVAAWFSNVEVFSQVTQIWEIDDLGSFGRYRSHLMRDAGCETLNARLESFAPVRRHRGLEPLVEAFSDVLHDAIAESRESAGAVTASQSSRLHRERCRTWSPRLLPLPKSGSCPSS